MSHMPSLPGAIISYNSDDDFSASCRVLLTESVHQVNLNIRRISRLGPGVRVTSHGVTNNVESLTQTHVTESTHRLTYKPHIRHPAHRQLLSQQARQRPPRSGREPHWYGQRPLPGCGARRVSGLAGTEFTGSSKFHSESVNM
jgi:hypothetical protein